MHAIKALRRTATSTAKSTVSEVEQTVASTAKKVEQGGSKAARKAEKAASGGRRKALKAAAVVTGATAATLAVANPEALAEITEGLGEAAGSGVASFLQGLGLPDMQTVGYVVAGLAVLYVYRISR